MQYVAVGNFDYVSPVRNIKLVDLSGEGGNALTTQPHPALFQFILDNPGGDWHTTAYYQIVRAKIESGATYYDISVARHGEQAWVKLEEWYQARCELLAQIQREGMRLPVTYVRVNRADGWRNQLDDGLHRCAIALALGWESIPAVCLNAELTALAQQFYKNEQNLYQPVYAHVDAAEWTDYAVIRHGTLERAALITKHLPGTARDGKKALDIGCNMGYFSFLLADLCPAMRVEAVDTMAYYAQWTAVLTRVLSVQGPRWYKGRVVTWQGNYEQLLPRSPFDVVLNLSVFHHVYLRDAAEFTAKMRRLSQVTDVMFFEMGTAEEEWIADKLTAQGREWIYQHHIPELIEECTNFQVQDLGKTDYRHLFLCTK